MIDKLSEQHLQVIKLLQSYKPYLIDIEQTAASVDYGEVELVLHVHNKQVVSVEFVEKRSKRYKNIESPKRGDVVK